jgi:hypothetical protein
VQANTGFLAGIEPLGSTYRIDLISMAADYPKELNASRHNENEWNVTQDGCVMLRKALGLPAPMEAGHEVQETFLLCLGQALIG